MAGLILEFIFGILKFFSSAALAILSIHFGIRAFDRLTEGIEEIDELKKGNTAVGILLASLVVSIALLAGTGISEFSKGLSPDYSLTLLLALAFVNLVKLAFLLIIAIAAIFLSLSFLDRLTKDISEIDELKENNVAIAVLIAGVLISTAFMVSSGMTGLVTSGAMDSCSIAISLADSGLPIDAGGCYLALGIEKPIVLKEEGPAPENPENQTTEV